MLKQNISLPEEPLSCGDQFQNANATRFPESAAKADIHEIWQSPTREAANTAFDIGQLSLSCPE
jgi:hypothetical protein